MSRLRFVLPVAFISSCVSTSLVEAQTLWTEGAENGLTYVIDGTQASYPLIQSDIVSNGDHAFHLANPGFTDSYFEIDQDITVQSNTKLFFSSRLGWASNTQFAKLQLSTDGGSTFPTELFSQAGTGNQGEGAFGLKTIDLGSYANQSLRFRFAYESTPFTSIFTQTSADVGWLVDDIQIGDQLEKTQYSVGDPSPHEQQYLEFINRARSDALVEAQRLADTDDSDISSAYSFFGIDRADIVSQFETSVNDGCLDQHAQPLSFNENLMQAAQLHTQDLFDNAYQGHNSSSNPPAPFLPGYSLGQRLDAVGYSGGAGENVFSYAEKVEEGHAGFDVDWGNLTNSSHPCYNPAFNGQGMQNGAGHRASIHNGDYKEIGIGVINGTNTVGGNTVGPQLVTQDFGTSGGRLITGVVYEDLNGNEFYDIGEGRSGVRVDVDGSAFYAISSTSGAYSIPVSEDGQYTVEFTGGGFSEFLATADVSAGLNVKIDYLASAITYLATDYNENGVVDIADYEIWTQTLGSTTDLRADGNNDMVVDAADFTAWRDTLGDTSTASLDSANVPEPAGWLLLVAGMAVLALRSQVRN